MKKFHPLRKLLVCLALLLTVGAFDYFTGYEVTSFPVYLLPTLLAFFYFGKVGGYVMGVVAVTVWNLADVASGHQLSSPLFRIWNSGCRLAIYFLFVYGVSVYTQTVAAYRNRLEALRRVMPMCHNCGRIFGADGQWHSPEDMVSNAGRDLPECPECEVVGKSSNA